MLTMWHKMLNVDKKLGLLLREQLYFGGYSKYPVPLSEHPTCCGPALVSSLDVFNTVLLWTLKHLTA